jgi:hypothetical protein
MPIAIRFHGQETAAGRIRKFRTTTLNRLEKEVARQGKLAVDFIREQMNAAYVREPGPSRVGNSVGIVI